MSAITARFTSGHADLRRRRRGLLRLSVPGGRRSAMVALLVVMSMATFAAGAAADSGHAQQPPRMHFGDRVKLAYGMFWRDQSGGRSEHSVWVSLHGPGRPVDPSTPAIILVHGIASSTEN